MVPMLLRSRHDVIGLDSNLYENCTFEAGGIAAVPSIRKDIRDLVRKDLEGLDAIIHLATLSNDPIGNIRPALTYEINHHDSVRLAVLAKEAGVKRFLLASSCSNCGRAGEAMLDETGALNPITAYGESIIRSERDISPVADDDFCPTHLRPATATGVFPRRGAEQLYSGYCKSKPTLEDFEGPRHQRIGHIQKLVVDGILADDLRHCHTAQPGADRKLAVAKG
jgi:nucleoside-diphosphate-sugar epimerase